MTLLAEDSLKNKSREQLLIEGWKFSSRPRENLPIQCQGPDPHEETSQPPLLCCS